MSHGDMKFTIRANRSHRSRFAWLFALVAVAGCATTTGKNVEMVSTVGSQGAATTPARSAPEDSRAMGRTDAPVAIVEYSDYQCPYCQRFHAEVLPRLKSRYIDAGKVRFFFRDLPLTMHRESTPAAVAARCAADQGKFWAMNEALFANQSKLGTELYTRLAQTLALDGNRFRECQQQSATRQAVQRDALDAGRYGLHSTPSFILGRVDGDRVEIHRVARGFADFETFAREIEAVLKTTPTANDGPSPGSK